MSAVLESETRFPGAPMPDADAMSAMQIERQHAVEILVSAMGGVANEAVRAALEAAYTFGRLHAIQYARRVR
mgnify:CR=1 FL=1